MTDRDTACESAADASKGGDSDGDSAADVVPWTDFDDVVGDGKMTLPPPSPPKPAQVIAGTTAFIEPDVYCQHCPKFDDSAGDCTNADTDIVQALQDGRFYVTNCPAVTSDGPDFERVQRD